MTAKRQTLISGLFLQVLALGFLSGTLVFLALRGKEIVALSTILLALGGVVIFVRPEIGILVFLTTFFVTYGDFLPTEGRFTPNNLLGLFFTVLLLVKIYQERNLWFLKDRVVQIFLVIVLFFHFSSQILEQQSGDPFPELDATAQKLHDLTTRFVFFIFLVNFIRTLRDVKLVLWTLLGIILVSSVSGVLNSLQGAGFGIGGYRAAAEWGINAAGNANRLAFFCALGIALSWYYKQVVRSRLLSLFLNAAIPGLAIAALMTASRSGLLNLFVVFALLAMEGRFSLRRQLNLVLVAAVVIFLASDFLSDTHVERLGNIPLLSSTDATGTGSTEKRLETLTDGLKIVAADPMLGTGIGNFGWVRLQRFGTAGSSHNSYLWAATEGGVPTLVLYLLLFGLALKNFLEAERKSNRLEVRLIARGLRTGLISFLFFTFFAEFWLSIVTYVLVGLAIVLRRLQAEELTGNFGVRANR